MTRTRSHSQFVRWVTFAAFMVALFATALSGFRAYRSLLLLHSAYEVGVPDLADIRPWMTLRYVAKTHRVDETALIGRLGLPRPTDPEISLITLAEQHGMSRFQYVQNVQRAIADVETRNDIEKDNRTASWLDTIGDELIAAVIGGGYPMLGFILLLGAIGLPVPTGLATVVAGSLSAHEEMSWTLAATIAVIASVIGDMAGYALGRLLSRGFLERHGRWMGYTPARRARVEKLFDRWGGVTVFLSRTLMSHLSSVVNLLAGAGSYRMYRFFLLTVAGRLIWTSAYLGLGYAVGTDLDAATGFLTDLSISLLSAAVLLAFTIVTLRQAKAAPPGGS